MKKQFLLFLQEYGYLSMYSAELAKVNKGFEDLTDENVMGDFGFVPSETIQGEDIWDIISQQWVERMDELSQE